MTIAIHATEDNKESQYVLTANEIFSDQTNYIKIENGVPQHGSVKIDEWQYYYFKTSDLEPITAVVIPHGGDPNIYASIANLDFKELKTAAPTSETYLKKSDDSYGADMLLVTPKELKECGSS
jgi:hypothetical protein